MDIQCQCGAAAPITMMTNLGGGYQKNCPSCHGDAQTASLNAYLSSAECAEDERQKDLHDEAMSVIECYGSALAAFKMTALAGQHELAAHVASIAGLAPKINGAASYIEACSNNAIRYGVCNEHSLESWCESTFTA